MDDFTQRTDAELLAERERFTDAFAVFYRRHVQTVLALCARRGLTAEEAADLTAETFMTAMRSRQRYRPELGEARGWLLGIAKHKLADEARRWSRAQRLQRRLEFEPIELSAQDVADYAALSQHETHGPATAALAELPEEQRTAVSARIVHGRDYSTIGRELGVSQATARQRVSRGLAALRTRLKESQ